MNDLIEQSKIFCSDKLLEEVLGMERITKSNNIKEFITQILSRDLGTMVKTKTYFFDKPTQKKIESDIFADIYKAVHADPVEPTPFQVAVTFIGAKALMTHRFAHQLWQDNRKEDALTLSSAALSNYHVNIHPSAHIEAGVFIDHGFGVQIKENAKIGSGTYILHKAKIGSDVAIGTDAFIGAGAKIASGVNIGNNVTIAAGAHITADVPDGQTVFGFYNEGGSSKIIPASHYLQIPLSMQSYHNQITADKKILLDKKMPPKKETIFDTFKNMLAFVVDNNIFNDTHKQALEELKGLIPFNPNSPLTVSNLDRFYRKCHAISIPNEKTMGSLALLSSHIAHTAWQESQMKHYSTDEQTALRNFSLWLQGRMATIFKVDIHPAVDLGKNVKFPAEIKKGIVIGATATVGDNTYIGDGVTLGGNGKEKGDRHPKISANCYIGNDALVLGAGTLGAGSIILPDSVLSLPKGTIKQAKRIYAGKPAIDVTADCNRIPKFKAFLDDLNKTE